MAGHAANEGAVDYDQWRRLWPGPSIRLCGHRHAAAYRCTSRNGMLPLMATQQIAVRLPEELLRVLDDLVDRGVYESRAAAVRAGIEAVVELDRRRRTDLAVVEGYRRVPPTGTERQAAVASLRDAILEEPW